MMSLMMENLEPHVSKGLGAVKFTEPNPVGCMYKYFKLRYSGLYNEGNPTPPSYTDCNQSSLRFSVNWQDIFIQ